MKLFPNFMQFIQNLMQLYPNFKQLIQNIMQLIKNFMQLIQNFMQFIRNFMQLIQNSMQLIQNFMQLFPIFMQFFIFSLLYFYLWCQSFDLFPSNTKKLSLSVSNLSIVFNLSSELNKGDKSHICRQIYNSLAKVKKKKTTAKLCMFKIYFFEEGVGDNSKCFALRVLSVSPHFL